MAVTLPKAEQSPLTLCGSAKRGDGDSLMMEQVGVAAFVVTADGWVKHV